jgi:predicted Co/Zn/Cd cation transporter (cation efflux family)
VNRRCDVDARTDVVAKENLALRVSLGASIVIGAIGVVWGIATDSRIVLFDGVYTFFGTALSGLSLLAAWIASRDATVRYPFGREAMIPVAIVLQGAALLGTLVVALVDSVALILAGGSDPAGIGTIAYALLTGALALVVMWVIPRIAPHSELVAAERDQWKAGMWLSLLIAVGAAATYGIVALGWHGFAPYGDSVLVILAVLGLLPVPYGLLRSGGREILEAAPPPEVGETIEDAARRVGASYDVGEPHIRATKLGRRLYVEVDYLVSRGEWDVSDEDAVRRALIAELEESGLEIWANVELTTDPALLD